MTVNPVVKVTSHTPVFFFNQAGPFFGNFCVMKMPTVSQSCGIECKNGVGRGSMALDVVVLNKVPDDTEAPWFDTKCGAQWLFVS